MWLPLSRAFADFDLVPKQKGEAQIPWEGIFEYWKRNTFTCFWDRFCLNKVQWVWEQSALSQVLPKILLWHWGLYCWMQQLKYRCPTISFPEENYSHIHFLLSESPIMFPLTGIHHGSSLYLHFPFRLLLISKFKPPFKCYLTQLTWSENKFKQINSFLPWKSSNVTVCNRIESIGKRVGRSGSQPKEVRWGWS